MVISLDLKQDRTLLHVVVLGTDMTGEGADDMIIEEEAEDLIEAVADVVIGGAAIETKNNRKHEN